MKTINKFSPIEIIHEERISIGHIKSQFDEIRKQHNYNASQIILELCPIEFTNLYWSLNIENMNIMITKEMDIAPLKEINYCGIQIRRSDSLNSDLKYRWILIIDEG